MEAGIVIAIIAVVGLFVVLGLFVYRTKGKPKAAQGILNVDYSDPIDGPYFFLQLKVPVSDVVSKKQVVFDVNITNYISQK
jgi:hypothetical protein